MDTTQTVVQTVTVQYQLIVQCQCGQKHAYSLRDAFRCIAQPNTTLLDCILYSMQYPYDPGTLLRSANYCTLGKVYLGSDQPCILREQTCPMEPMLFVCSTYR